MANPVNDVAEFSLKPGQSPMDVPASSRRDQIMVLLAAFLGWMFDGVEMGLFPLVARPALQEMMGPQAASHIGTWLSGIIAVFLLGAAAGGILFGWLGDRVGRVRAMIWSVLTYSIFSGLCGFSQTPMQLAILRSLASLGMGGEWALGVALIMEVWPARHRPILAGLIGAASNVGFLLIAFMGLALTQFIGGIGSLFHTLHVPQGWSDALLRNSGWRLLLFLGAAPAIFTLLISVFVPESEKWQHASKTATRKNKVSDVFAGGLARMTIIGTFLASIALLGTWGSVQWIPSWADKMVSESTLQKMPEALRGVPASIKQAKAAGASARAAAQIWSGFGACVGCVVAAVFAQWTSRRATYFVLCVLSLGACQYLFRANLPYGSAMLFWIFIVGGLTAAFYGWLPLYLPELFPTRIRATAQGFSFNFGRVLASAGTLFAGQLLNHFHEDYGKMCSWISLIYIVGLFVIWFAPETKGKPLPE